MRAPGRTVNIGLRIPKAGDEKEAAENLTVEELGQLGVARVSVGPRLWAAAVEDMTYAAGRVLRG